MRRQRSVTIRSAATNTADPPACADPINGVQSAGILVSQAASPLLISANTIDANDMGIYTSSSGVQITGNFLGNTTANRYEGIFLDQGDATLTSNTIKNGDIGVVLVSYSGSTGNSVGTMATGNTISGATVAGIKLLSQPEPPSSRP